MPPEWQVANESGASYGTIVPAQPANPADPPTISALVAKLSGDVDPAKIIQYAPGEVQNLPGYQGAVFVLQLNADSLASDQGPLTDAMNVVDDQTIIAV